MSNEEIVEDFIKEIRDFELNKDIIEIVYALEAILEEKKQDKSRIEELEIKQKEMCEEYCPKTERIKKLEEENQQKNMFVKMAKEVIENSILKQKVEGEINSLRNMLKATTKGILQEYTVEEIIIKINTLEELLEEK